MMFCVHALTSDSTFKKIDELTKEDFPVKDLIDWLIVFWLIYLIKWEKQLLSVCFLMCILCSFVTFVIFFNFFIFCDFILQHTTYVTQKVLIISEEERSTLNVKFCHWFRDVWLRLLPRNQQCLHTLTILALRSVLVGVLTMVSYTRALSSNTQVIHRHNDHSKTFTILKYGICSNWIKFFSRFL